MTRCHFGAWIAPICFIFLMLFSLVGEDIYASSSDESSTKVEFTPGTFGQKINDIAAASSCAQYSWKSRGHAPAGYIKGMALSYARSVCRLHMGNLNGPALLMSSPDTHNDHKDALTHYHSILSALQLMTNTAGVETLRSVYTIGIGLGMRESSGAYCVGWDTSAGSNRPSSAAEAGAFQVSYDSMVASNELRNLYAEYQKSPERCNLNVFKEGARCSSQAILGSGAGAAFQSFNKACPAFAAEYAMTLLRVLRGHFGPINRREAEVNLSCHSMLKSVQQVLDSDLNSACRELF